VGSENLLSDSIGLMILGMGTVFVFLSVLVIVTSLMSSLVQKYVSEEILNGVNGVEKLSSSSKDQQTLLTVISAAIHVHRSRKKN
jgi:oxaloacetate decarboxylase gamma subunit